MSAEKLADRLTMIGFEVENIYRSPSSFQGIVVGKILDIEKHPYADKLNICSVDIGKEKLSIVCGAQNVRKGQHVPVALKGSRLAYGVKIKTVKIRGVQSEGMICSEKELGLGEDHNGILVLDIKTNTIGKPFKHFSKSYWYSQGSGAYFRRKGFQAGYYIYRKWDSR
jgi:phenylalanyl-tRNA synthetase beta chain